jgi:hypothetical protein
MNEKKNSATQRVLKSVVAPALGTSLALLIGCSTSTPPNDKPGPVGGVVQPGPDMPEKVGKVAPLSNPSTQGATVTTPPPVPLPGVVMPATNPATTPTAEKDPIPEPGKVMPEKVGTVPKPGKIQKVGKEAPRKVGKVAPDKAPLKVGIIQEDDSANPFRTQEERPTRLNRRVTDTSGGVLRTGFIGGRKLT